MPSYWACSAWVSDSILTGSTCSGSVGSSLAGSTLADSTSGSTFTCSFLGSFGIPGTRFTALKLSLFSSLLFSLNASTHRSQNIFRAPPAGSGWTSSDSRSSAHASLRTGTWATPAPELLPRPARLEEGARRPKGGLRTGGPLALTAPLIKIQLARTCFQVTGEPSSMTSPCLHSCLKRELSLKQQHRLRTWEPFLPHM